MFDQFEWAVEAEAEHGVKRVCTPDRRAGDAPTRSMDSAPVMRILGASSVTTYIPHPECAQ